MSPRDLAATLRETRPAAPPELRERVRLLAAAAPAAPQRRITWRRAALVLVPVAAAIAAAVVFLPGGRRTTAPQVVPPHVFQSGAGARMGADHSAALAPSLEAPAIPAPSATRLQRYSASLELRLRSAAAVSDATKRATAIAAALGGYPLRLDVHTGTSPSSGDLVFRVPRVHVREAVRRFSALGTIVNEDVSIQDLTSEANAATDLIAGLQRRLAALRTQQQTTLLQRQIAALTTRIENLQRAQAATLRAAHYATVELRLTTRTPSPLPARHHHGPLHGLGIAFHWLWIGAVYALALGAPFAALVAAAWIVVRLLRRRREDALLSRS